MGTPLTPLFSTTTATVAKGSTLEVDVGVDDKPLSMVRVRPSQAPDSGSVHEVGLNASTPLIEHPTVFGGSPDWLKLQPSGRLDGRSNYRIVKVFVKSGADGTTFDIDGLL